jgi:hypothetical protein
MTKVLAYFNVEGGNEGQDKKQCLFLTDMFASQLESLSGRTGLHFQLVDNKFEISPSITDNILRKVVSGLSFASVDISATGKSAPDWLVLAGRIDEAWSAYDNLFNLLLNNFAFDGTNTVGTLLPHMPPGYISAALSASPMTPKIYHHLMQAWVTKHTQTTNAPGNQGPKQLGLFPLSKLTTPSFHTLVQHVHVYLADRAGKPTPGGIHIWGCQAFEKVNGEHGRKLSAASNHHKEGLGVAVILEDLRVIINVPPPVDKVVCPHCNKLLANAKTLASHFNVIHKRKILAEERRLAKETGATRKREQEKKFDSVKKLKLDVIQKCDDIRKKKAVQEKSRRKRQSEELEDV